MSVVSRRAKDLIDHVSDLVTVMELAADLRKEGKITDEAEALEEEARDRLKVILEAVDATPPWTPKESKTNATFEKISGGEEVPDRPDETSGERPDLPEDR